MIRAMLQLQQVSKFDFISGSDNYSINAFSRMGWFPDALLIYTILSLME